MADNGNMNKLLRTFLDLLYPPGLYCICCGKITDQSRTYSMCNDCISKIKWTGAKSCVRCGKALGDNDPGALCFNCKENIHYFDRGYSCAEYGTYEKALLYKLKYASRADIAEVIAEIVYDRMEAELGQKLLSSSYDLVIPVPIYKKRKERRGFNQSDVIAKAFARKAGIKYDNDLLVRMKPTQPMKGLNPEERKANIKGAFRVRDHKRETIAGADILIIDDIYTTGATIDEIAKCLKNPFANPIAEGSKNSASGATGVDFCVFASGADYIIT